MITPIEEVRKLQGEIDKLISEAAGTCTPELGEELNSRARRISEIVEEVNKKDGKRKV